MNEKLDFATFFINKKPTDNKILWLHGWGQSHKALLPMAEFFDDTANNMLVDFPGFGQSNNPPEDWGSKEYMEALYQQIVSNNFVPTYIVAHSFGCRVAIRMAAKYPDAVKGLILIAAAGLKRKRSVFFKIKASFIKLMVKASKIIDNFFKTSIKSILADKFGSSDYKNAGLLRNSFVKVVNENLEEEASQIKAKTLLIFGENDEQTPKEFGIKYQQLIADSKLIILKNQDHYSVLTTAKSQVMAHIKSFLEEK